MHKLFHKILLPFLLSLAATVNAAVPTTNEFGVTPMSITLSGKDAIKSMILANSSSNFIMLDSKIFRWQKINGADFYTPDTSKAVMVVPPVFRLKAKSNQMLRIALLNRLPHSQEIMYKVFLTESASSGDLRSQLIRQNDTNSTQKEEIKLNFRVGIPIYVLPDNPFRKLVWQVQNDGEKIKIHITNQGNAHVKIIRIYTSPLDQSNTTLTQVEPFISVYPGETSREFTLFTPPSSNGRMQIHVVTDPETPAIGTHFDL
ncbi:MAG: hypothetical protein A2X78_03475 [Gammaproteobacteria bacterium GWE2_37_16]|nr:MAG: hypothetical protein A2X78_03475 [Gammaproteobacteria bacterium GWE2_37_16]